MRELASNKNRFRGHPSKKDPSKLGEGLGVGDRWPGRGYGGRRFGRKEERKSGIFEDLKKVLHALTRRVGGFG